MLCSAQELSARCVAPAPVARGDNGREDNEMPIASIAGISTYYEVVGSGPPLLMYSPGGFNAALETWRTQGIYSTIKLLDHLPKKYTCITFDRRESGRSGGRVERITWADYAAQGKGLLDHLGLRRAHIMGGCMGANCAAAFGATYPRMTVSLVLYWPVGGAKYRLSSHQRFATHLAYIAQNGLPAVADLVAQNGQPFSKDARGGPWAAVLGTDKSFSEAFARQNLETYKTAVAGMARTLFDRDTAPGAEPEDLMLLNTPALVIPGRDAFHGTSAARYLEECLPNAEYWDMQVELQTEAVTPTRILSFLDSKTPTQVSDSNLHTGFGCGRAGG
jgi:pimeloyl-ACP methyl ester carboxylesterase